MWLSTVQRWYLFALFALSALVLILRPELIATSVAAPAFQIMGVLLLVPALQLLCSGEATAASWMVALLPLIVMCGYACLTIGWEPEFWVPLAALLIGEVVLVWEYARLVIDNLYDDGWIGRRA